MRSPRRVAIALLGALTIVASCGGEDPVTTNPEPSELQPGALPAGTYTHAAFSPAIVFALDEGWSTGVLTRGFFDVQQDPGSPDVIAIQFGIVQAVIGDGGALLQASTAAEAVAAITDNPGLTVIGQSASRLGGREGLNIEVANESDRHASVMKVQPGVLGIDPGRRLWISLFDVPDGLLVVMVGGSTAQWDRALTEAEPVLESVVIGDG